MIKKWLWLTIGAVGAGFLIMAIAARYSEPKQSEAAASSRQVPAPAPLTFRERKERGLLTPEEQRIADEIAKMQEANKEYEKQRQIRIAREEAEKANARERQSEWNEYVAKKQALRPTRSIGRTSEEFWADVDEDYARRSLRYELRKERWNQGLPTQGPTFWEKLLDPEW